MNTTRKKRRKDGTKQDDTKMQINIKEGEAKPETAANVKMAQLS